LIAGAARPDDGPMQLTLDGDDTVDCLAQEPRDRAAAGADFQGTAPACPSRRVEASMCAERSRSSGQPMAR
jgi:hypothetical protein